ncbi:MAG TPA: class I SAM-dependent methyltransferase [Acidimicrobiia bacterium]|nr:class I SAM-dependent methyltransferase [Acidimicrobiia bacterium]
MMWKGDFDGERFQSKFDDLAASGVDVHGEASFVASLEPSSVLDAGCGTGRVAIELARRGIAVVGVDVDESMLTTAKSRAPEIEWILHDVATLDLGRTFDVVVMAGNVPLFTPAESQAALIAGCARHVAPGGVLVAGFQTQRENRRYSIEQYDAHCAAAGLELSERYSTWDRQAFVAGGDYAVSVHRRR